jgi:hypothetical protein
MIEFVRNTMKLSGADYKRSNSESGFAGDKKMLGWGITQKRERIESTALNSALGSGIICSIWLLQWHQSSSEFCPTLGSPKRSSQFPRIVEIIITHLSGRF